MMQLTCKSCGAAIDADNINLDHLIAKCAYCDSVFSFADQFGGPADEQFLPRPAVSMPKGISVANRGYELAITRSWFGARYVLLTFFTLVWNGFLVMWYGIALSQRMWEMGLFASGHALIGVALIYATIAGYINKTLITVGSGRLKVEHGPLPWIGNKQLDAVAIKQLYCKERIHRGRNSTSYSYEVHAVTEAGVDEKVVSGLHNSEQALYLEQEIERFLGIKDRPVRGEFVR